MSKKIDDVKLKIDYDIIQHFSKYLYGSPTKAIDELVSNSFDAGALKVNLYIPGPQTKNAVIVWDDGTGMDVNELQNMWWIARSPKKEENREIKVIVKGKTYNRKVIGKFGIGKLASYAVGDEMQHLCRKEDKFLLVGVNYAKLRELSEAATIENPPEYDAPILSLSEKEARNFVDDLFDGTNKAKAIKEHFDKESWTIAIITELNEQKLFFGRLMWLLGNGMPLRPDFQVWLNDELVTPKLEKDALFTWDFKTDEIQEAITSVWKEWTKHGKVTGKVTFESEVGLNPSDPKADIPFVKLPNLGKVYGEMRLFKKSLIEGKPAEIDRSHGFFIMVRGRLLNPDDDKLFITDPSYGAFNSSQFILNADELDNELLADRERINKHTPRTIELEVLSRAVYQALRKKKKEVEEKEAEELKPESLLPIRSNDFYREPIFALLNHYTSSTEERAKFEIDKPKIEKKILTTDDPLTLFTPENGGFQLNVKHPFYEHIQEDLGNNKTAQKFLRFVEMFAVADRLLEGQLYQMGISTDLVERIMRWRDGQFRQLAESSKRNPNELYTNLYNTSFVPGKPFENALAAILDDMGFACEVDGASGKKDVLVAAHIGTDSYKLIFEAKGCDEKYTIANDKAEISGAASHIDDGATHAVVVAREFTGFGKDKTADAQVLKECRTIKGDAVSIMSVEAIIRLHQAVSRYHYRLDSLKDIFFKIEPPAEKLRRIEEELNKPMQNFDFRLVLEKIWERQKRASANDVVPYRGLMQDINFELNRSYSQEDFNKKLQALSELADELIELNLTKETIFLRNKPEHIIEYIEKNIASSLSDSELPFLKP